MVVSPTVCLADGFFNLHCSNWAILRAENNANVCPSFWVIVRTSIRPAAFGVDYAAIRDRLQSVELHHLTQAAHDAAVRYLCDELTATETIFPGTDLRLVYTLGPSQIPRDQEVGLSALIVGVAARATLRRKSGLS